VRDAGSAPWRIYCERKWRQRPIAGIYKQLADQIVKIIERGGKDGWSFAAPAEIHSAIVDSFLPAGRAIVLSEHVKSDLVKVEPRNCRHIFRSLRPIEKRCWILDGGY